MRDGSARVLDLEQGGQLGATIREGVEDKYGSREGELRGREG